MLIDYIMAAMNQANFDMLEDGSYYGRIPGLDGVWANRESLRLCEEELKEVLEGWMILRLSRGLEIPEISGVSLYAKGSI